MNKQINYPFKTKDVHGQEYLFDKANDGMVQITHPDGERTQVEGDELAVIAKAFKQHQLKIIVGGKIFDVLSHANKVLAYSVLYGKDSIIRIADTAGNVYEFRRGKFRFVNTVTYEAYTILPEDREYVVEPILATYTEGMHPTRTDDVTDMDG